MYQFGISTHLFHEHRLSRDHLVHVAAHGFESFELFATRSHFDYRNQQAIDELVEWLSDTRLTLHSVHAPIVERMQNGRWVGTFSNASSDESRRKAAVAETEAALAMASRIPFQFLVLHLGVPTSEQIERWRQSRRGSPAQRRGDRGGGCARQRPRGGRSHSECAVRCGHPRLAGRRATGRARRRCLPRLRSCAPDGRPR